MTVNLIVAIAIVGIGGILLIADRVHSQCCYRPSRKRVAELLSRALAGTDTEDELDYFMCVPIKHDSLIEQIREEFTNLYGPSAFEGTQMPGEQPAWSPPIRERVQTMVDSLRPATYSYHSSGIKARFLIQALDFRHGYQQCRMRLRNIANATQAYPAGFTLREDARQ